METVVFIIFLSSVFYYTIDFFVKFNIHDSRSLNGVFFVTWHYNRNFDDLLHFLCDACRISERGPYMCPFCPYFDNLLVHTPGVSQDLHNNFKHYIKILFKADILSGRHSVLGFLLPSQPYIFDFIWYFIFKRDIILTMIYFPPRAI